MIKLNVTLLYNGVTSHEALGHVSDFVIQLNVNLLFNGVTYHETLGHVSDSCDTTECYFAL